MTFPITLPQILQHIKLHFLFTFHSPEISIDNIEEFLNILFFLKWDACTSFFQVSLELSSRNGKRRRKKKKTDESVRKLVTPVKGYSLKMKSLEKQVKYILSGKSFILK